MDIFLRSGEGIKMNNQFSQTARVIGMICFLGVTSTSPRVAAEPAGCKAAFAFKSNDFGECTTTLSLVGTGSPRPINVYMSGATEQIAMAVNQYNSAFATNYAQWVVKRQWVAAQNSHNKLQLVTFRPSIQCQTIDGSAASLCYGVQVALKP